MGLLSYQSEQFVRFFKSLSTLFRNFYLQNTQISETKEFRRTFVGIQSAAGFSSRLTQADVEASESSYNILFWRRSSRFFRIEENDAMLQQHLPPTRSTLPTTTPPPTYPPAASSLPTTNHNSSSSRSDFLTSKNFFSYVRFYHNHLRVVMTRVSNFAYGSFALSAYQITTDALHQ